MLKRTLILSLLFSFTADLFAKNLDTTLIIIPDRPLEWRYINATISVNQVSYPVNSNITLQVKQNDIVSLSNVIAMNGIRPKIDNSCYFKIQDERSTHQLIFALQSDWRVYCRYL